MTAEKQSDEKKLGRSHVTSAVLALGGNPNPNPNPNFFLGQGE
jgi:hypothetical protein